VNQTGLRLDEANQRISEADKTIQAQNHDIMVLEEKENTLKKQIEALETDLEQKGELSERLRQLEKLDFGEERLKGLDTALAEIGTKRGLKRDEAVNTFFAELKDYDAVRGFTHELQRLESIVRTKSLESQRWQAEADTLARRHKDRNEAIAAVQSLTRHGVKVEQIVSWNRILTRLGGAEKLRNMLGQYKSVSVLLGAKNKEVKAFEQTVP